ncbi:MAG: response regulator [Myxococcales bacterium]|nr:response regulator [Myxococcales bacterium]MCB9519806.1 response regulator [Myxococcales bacterium]
MTDTDARSVDDTRPSVLVVDDDARFRERLARALRERDLDVRVATTGEEALASVRDDPPELAVVDLRMPGEWGLHVVRQLLDESPETRVVVLTAYGSIATALEALRLGAVNFLQKPVSVDELLRAFNGPGDAVAVDAEPHFEVPSLAKAEWEHINRVLTECDGNIRQAARLLGLHRRTLQRKLAKFPVDR